MGMQINRIWQNYMPNNTTSSAPLRKKQIFLDPNRIQWSTYQFPQHLNFMQRLGIKFITNVYQRYTRNRKNTAIDRFLQKHVPIVRRHALAGDAQLCTFPAMGRLSCSEYTVVTIAELGLFRGIRAKQKRSPTFDMDSKRDRLLPVRRWHKDLSRSYFTEA
jgi:hypothetical protein